MRHRLPHPALPTLATLARAAAVALLALAGAHAFWRVAAPLPIPAPPSPPTGLAHPGVDALFGSPPAGGPRRSGTLRLVGVIAEGDEGNDSGVALIAADGQPVRAYRRGDTLGGAAGRAAGAPRVERIAARRAILSDGSELSLPAIDRK